jgi:serine/threonine protein kinase
MPVNPVWQLPPEMVQIIRRPDEQAEYVMERVIGRGAFGEVYLGYNQSDPFTKLAIKKLDPILAAVRKPQHRRHMLAEIRSGSVGKHRNSDMMYDIVIAKISGMITEAEILSRLSQYPQCQPYLACIRDYYLDEQLNFYIVMDYVEGPTLRKYVRQYNPPVEFYIDVIAKLAQALTYIHGNNIIHNDIKPDNIIIRMGPGGQVDPVLVDFGLSCVADKVKQVNDLDYNYCSSFAGTIQYMAPELFSGELPHYYVSDIWSLGASIYYSIYNRNIWGVFLSARILQQIYHNDDIQPAQLNTDNQFLNNIVNLMTVKDFQQRITAPALVEMIQQRM